MKIPKISIITPSFNQGRYLEQTILSVLEQNYPDLEYIIIDGGSTDNSVEIIKKYERHLKFWVSEKDRGQSDAINKGLRQVTGEIFNSLNSDDYYNEKVFFRLADLFSDPGVNVVTGRSKIFGIDRKDAIAHGTFFDPSDLDKTLCYSHIEQPATFFRKIAVDRIGFLSKDLHYVMDKEWWIKYLFNFGLKNIIKVDDVFVNFRHHNDSKTIAASQKFYNDQANLLYSLCAQKNLREYANLLFSEFVINEKYQFLDNSLGRIENKTIEKMVVFFFLHKANLIFTKQDFDFAMRVTKKINVDKLSLTKPESDWAEEIRKKSKLKFWFLFRIWRKYHHIFNSD